MSQVRTDQQADALLAHLAQGLGFQVWGKFRSVAITPDSLRLACTAAGIDPTSIPDIKPDTAVARGVRDFAHTETVESADGTISERARCRAEIVKRSSDVLVIGILRHERLASSRVRKEQSDTLVWNRVTRCWDDPGQTEHADLLRAKVQHAMTYLDGNDIRMLIVKPALSRCGAFTIKDGVYFVPRGASEELSKLQRCLAEVEGYALCVGGLPAGAGFEAPLAEDARASLTNDLDALLQQIEGWEAMARRVSSSSQETVLNRFAELQQLASSYEDALQISLEDLQEKLVLMQTRAQDVIELREEEASAKEGKPKALTEEEKAAARTQTIYSQVGKMSDDEVSDMLDLLSDEDVLPDTPADEKRALLIAALGA